MAVVFRLPTVSRMCRLKWATRPPNWSARREVTHATVKEWLSPPVCLDRSVRAGRHTKCWAHARSTFVAWLRPFRGVRSPHQGKSGLHMPQDPIVQPLFPHQQAVASSLPSPLALGRLVAARLPRLTFVFLPPFFVVKNASGHACEPGSVCKEVLYQGRGFGQGCARGGGKKGGTLRVVAKAFTSGWMNGWDAVSCCYKLVGGPWGTDGLWWPSH